jgi:D-inositol-3-phosphate glycosyltransferase
MCLRVAMVSLHTSPLAPLGRSREAGGMNVYIRELARHLGYQNIGVDIFTRRSDRATATVQELSEHVRVVQLLAGPPESLPKQELFTYIPEFVCRVQAFALAQGADYAIVHSHYWLSTLAGTRLASMWDVPHVTMFHTLARLKRQARADEPESPQRLKSEQRVVHEVDGIVVATEHEREQLLRLYDVAPGRLHVIPCGVDLRRFTPAGRVAARNALGLGEQPVLLFVGRLDPFKGADLLIAAMAQLQQPATLLVVGGDPAGDPEMERLQGLACRWGVSRRVRFIGAVPHEQLPIYYRAADILVVPSYYESFGMVALEALACGTPVVATRAGGLPYVVRDGENGLLVSWRSPEAFACQLDRVLGDKALLERLRQQARPSVMRYSWPRIADQIHHLYHELTCPAVACGHLS